VEAFLSLRPAEKELIHSSRTRTEREPPTPGDYAESGPQIIIREADPIAINHWIRLSDSKG